MDLKAQGPFGGKSSTISMHSCGRVLPEINPVNDEQ
jgi:hypothetical protein